jgi:hypothetical protein
MSSHKYAETEVVSPPGGGCPPFIPLTTHDKGPSEKEIVRYEADGAFEDEKEGDLLRQERHQTLSEESE